MIFLNEVVSNKKYYRYTVGGVGIMADRFDDRLPIKAWKTVNWIPKPPADLNYGKHHRSYFTHKGMLKFKKKGLNEFKKGLPGIEKHSYSESEVDKIVYKDQYQIITLGTE